MHIRNVRNIALCLSISLLALLAAGCAQKAAEQRSDAGGSESAAEVQAADAEAPVERPSAAADDGAADAAPKPEFVIEHRDLSEGYPVEMYFELPVFREDTEALRRINEQLAAVQQAYFDNRAADDLEMVIESMGSDYGPTKEQPYTNAHSATVQCFTDKLVSVTFSYDWWMGGVADYGVETYTFSAKTGEQLFLTDLLEGTEEEIKESIVTALLEQYPGVEEAGVVDTPMDAIRGKDIRDFSFYVEHGTLHIVFSKYEISYGAAGAFDVPLYDALKLPA